MTEKENALCINAPWQEETKIEHCAKCPDHLAGVCTMPEACLYGQELERDRVLDILHNNYEVRNPEQNAFMDRLCMEVIKGGPAK